MKIWVTFLAGCRDSLLNSVPFCLGGSRAHHYSTTPPALASLWKDLEALSPAAEERLPNMRCAQTAGTFRPAAAEGPLPGAGPRLLG